MNESKILAGRKALVTGAARRVGKALALALAKAGADVAIHYRESAADAAQTAAEIEALGVRTVLTAADLTLPGETERVMAEAAAALGPIDILINNASVFEQALPLADDIANWDLNHEIHVRAPLRLTMAMADGLPAAAAGDVVNLNDWRALRPAVEYRSYTLSKSALHDQTRGLAVALAPRVRVNEIAMGAVLPPQKASEEYIHTLRDEIPLRRFPPLEDVCAAMIFVLSTSSITGQTICVDGGRHLV